MPEKNTDRVLDLIIDKLEKLDESQAKLSEEIQKTNLELSKISGIKYALGDIKKNVEERDQIVNIDDLKKIKDFYLKHQDINSDVEDLYLITGELRNITDDYKKFKTKTIDKNILKNRILEASLDGKLYNNNVFKEYFKGLYFKTQQTSAGAGAMAMLDFSKGYVVIQYHSDITTTDSDGNVTTTNAKRKLKLTFGGNTVNLLNHSNAANYQNSLNNSNDVVGNDRLYIKGNNGSMAFIDLFGADDSDPDDIPEELENLRANNWLINDAFLIFYVDKTAMSNSSISEPNRILLFDATNNKPLLDYSIDTSVSSNSKKNKYNYGGIVELEDVENGRAVKYKVRITNQIRNIINSEDEDLNKNIRLGLCVTENINLSSNAYLKTPISINGDEVEFTPIGNVINPLGTILYGNNVAPADEAKKLKLQIFYTKPN